MELHRIVAPDASKATAEALRLYGPDALVISTRRLKNDRTEIIVATEAADAATVATPEPPLALAEPCSISTTILPTLTICHPQHLQV